MFKQRLKELRKAEGLSQRQLATELNISQGTVGNWESGTREPNFNTINKIANFFHVTCDYLLGTTQEKHFTLWHKDQYKDYYKASIGEKEYLLKKWGRPHDIADDFTNLPFDMETIKVIEEAKDRPELKTLFSMGINATKQDVEKTLAILEALKNTDSKY